MSVYTAGGPNSGFEKAAGKAISGMQDKLDAISGNISSILKKAIYNPKRANSYWVAVEAELQAEYKKLSAVFEANIEKTIPAMYKGSLADVKKRIDSVKKITATASRTVTQIYNSQATSQLMGALITDATTAMDAAVTGGYKNAKRLTRATQQTLISEYTIDAAVAEAYASGDLINNFVDTLLRRSPEFADLYNSMVDEKRVIQAGRYKYKPEYYAELVARTKYHESQSYAAMAQAKNYGTDLVVVSNHNTRTAICQPYEAKTYSMTGKDKRFPVLDQAPPFHPNCLHLLYPVFSDAMEIDGTLEKQAEFSMGKTDRPPVPSGYIPLSERS